MKIDLSKRQLEIIEVSGKILMQKGVAGLTTKNLAQKMNFSESALYRHFKDKEEIITHLISYLSENINQRFESIINTDLSAEEKFNQLFKSQFSFFKANPHFIVIVLSEGLLDNSETIKNTILKLMQTNSNVFKNLILQGQESKTFNQNIDVDYLVHFIMGTFRLQMLKWKLSNFEFDIEKKGIETMTNLLTLIKIKK
ncbi:TetR/AcrR family transcriptional regulator [Empedobacter brevis]|uniref:TetR/AcrR family transcriptional regulator n=2 Tax=Empedobacter TaxID=59734 RepID=A0AAW7DLM2_9FLAO|nr:MULTISPECIES: TetR/AcrR family transcriptional regulator [Empedobacter]MDM1074318.1 TetR/AcrR family transcriptional regulator [Empedobacter brevis]MDM1549495.1 TetR/AcrR family transcriptional regulator [Empedobacter falsenii]MDM1552874.1 TetR/AcrR family transcriptional regulator [Empedobacter falsenii]